MEERKEREEREEKEVLSVEQLYNILVFEFLALRKAEGR